MQLRHLVSSERFQIEDFHTEIVAQVLRNSPALTLDWLREIGATGLQSADHIGIETQERLVKLETHTSGSRLDLPIRLVANGRAELIFVESKLPSTQGVDQLKKYAEQLEAAHRETPLAKTSLVFITRDYEFAEKPNVSDVTFKLNFCQTRWFVFYRHLKAHINSDGLAKELKLFMEENHMSLGNQFRSTDLVSLENFLSAKALMDETLQGKVTEAVFKILGSVTSLNKAAIQLRDHHRYVVYAQFEGFECHIGYWLPHQNPDEPVWVGITLNSNPTSKNRKDIVLAFREWNQKTAGAWEADNLDNEKAWVCIYKGKAIHALMSGADHVREIKNHLISLLDEVKEFKKAYPKLPWSITDDGGDEENAI